MVLERNGKVAYRLQLPETARIHIEEMEVILQRDQVVGVQEVDRGRVKF